MRMRRLRMSLPVVGLLSFALLTLTPAPLSAQTPFVPSQNFVVQPAATLAGLSQTGGPVDAASVHRFWDRI